jgi:HSP20 family molecular chaperone IbpA
MSLLLDPFGYVPRVALPHTVFSSLPVGHRKRSRDYWDDDLFDLLSNELQTLPAPKVKPLLIPSLQLSEEERGWVATLHLPGVSSIDDIALDLWDAEEGGNKPTLHIRAESRLRHQRRVYTQSFSFPQSSNPSRTTASFKNETLTIVIPRATPSPRRESKKPQQLQTVGSRPSPATREEKPSEQSSGSKELETPKKKASSPRPTSFEDWSLLGALPKLRQSEQGHQLLLELELPPLESSQSEWSQDDIDLEVKKGKLNIRLSKEGDDFTIVSNRSVSIPETVTAEDVSARLENNVLKISLPKPEPPRVFKVPIFTSSPSSTPQPDPNPTHSTGSQETNPSSSPELPSQDK